MENLALEKRGREIEQLKLRTSNNEQKYKTIDVKCTEKIRKTVLISPLVTKLSLSDYSSDNSFLKKIRNKLEINKHLIRLNYEYLKEYKHWKKTVLNLGIGETY